ncbi:MAG: hypothetical protein U0R65_10155 [Candidatus Nanopelagicales bacterium]
MAGRVGRLGALLTATGTDTREALLLETVAMLASVPSPRGAERALAEAVVDFASERWPAARWRVQDVDGPACAQVVADVGEGGGLLLYSHLDTSLTGDASFDVPITGAPPPVAGARIDLTSRTISGFGLGVAKAPAAAALVAFGLASERRAGQVGAGPLGLLLAARGTHRAPIGEMAEPARAPARTGLERYLADAPVPAAAVVAKGGPAGVLHDEPGAAYVRVTVRSGWGAVMARQAVRPPGGVLAQLGSIVTAVVDVGDSVARILADRAPGGQAGACFGIGAVRSGQAAKADLVPGIAEVVGYLVAPGTIDVDRVTSVFDAALREALAGLPGMELDVRVSLVHDGGSTPADAAVVRSAIDAWTRESREHAVLDAPVPTSGWTGSTDGVVLRAHGVPTARLGPSRTRSADGVDVVDLDELVAFTRVYEEIAAAPPA